MKMTLIHLGASSLNHSIRLLSSCLTRNNHQTQIIFYKRNFTSQHTSRELDAIADVCKHSDIVGLSVMTNFFDRAVAVTKRLKESKIPVIWGGIHAMVKPQECLEYADIVCTCEGEQPLTMLLDRLERSESHTDIQGLSFPGITNPDPRLITDLDALPFPDYNNDNHYLVQDGKLSQMDERLLLDSSGRMYMTLSSRGCPFGCSFCCNSFLNSKYKGQPILRKRDLSKFMEELRFAKKIAAWEEINITDDCFFAFKTKEIAMFCKEYKRDIGLPMIVGGLYPGLFKKEKLDLLVEAGLVDIRMGIQTVNEKMKRLYHRESSNDKLLRVAEEIGKHKIKIAYDFIVDNPYEDEESLIDDLLFITKLPKVPYRLGWFSLVFYPGTELYAKAKEDGLIKDEMNQIYRKQYKLESGRTGIGNSFFGKLFRLCFYYANDGRRIPTWVMKLLVSKRLRACHVSYLLYIALYLFVLDSMIMRFTRKTKKRLRRLRKERRLVTSVLGKIGKGSLMGAPRP